MASNISAQVPALLRRNAAAPGTLELGAQLVVFDMLEAGQAVGDRAHVAAALHVILPAQRD